MKRLLAALLITLPAWAAAPTGCGSLCGNWQLDTSLSAAVAPAVETALSAYSEPRGRKPPRSARNREGFPETTVDQIDSAMEHSLGPVFDRPGRAELRTELMAALTPPTRLNLDARGKDILIQGDGDPVRRLTPGTPKARVNANGTAEIMTNWKSERLTIAERYDKKNQYAESYALQTTGTLLVTREIKRPGLKPLKLQAIYRRS
jgi:antitoxin (DNA-binding transcriptional repressor) of toxin-antitoxin stability system